jgi:hypothetical protein
VAMAAATAAATAAVIIMTVPSSRRSPHRPLRPRLALRSARFRRARWLIPRPRLPASATWFARASFAKRKQQNCAINTCPGRKFGAGFLLEAGSKELRAGSNRSG